MDSKSALLVNVTRDYTVRLTSKNVGTRRRQKATKAINLIKKFVQKNMGTKMVKIDPDLNKFIWERGQKNVPKRVRIRVVRKRNSDEDAEERVCSEVSWVPIKNFKGIQTETVSED
eukprot:GHVP01055939.1.p1 GENE.GHVP01055939.1~~GHVP01055939.1.p1  ORF type:complete len:116 (+),score=23.25 GHVP01055939.1:162-509(+)